MGLNQWTVSQSAAGQYQLSAPVRITAEHLAALPVPETMITLSAFAADAQDNKTKRLLPGQARPSARLSWPVLLGLDALSGLPVQLTIQAGALRFELERLAQLDRVKLDPVDESAADQSWPELRAWVSRVVSEQRALRVCYLGTGTTADGQAFPRFRLALVAAAAADDYRAAWLDDASQVARVAPAAVAQLVSDAPSDPIPF